MSSSWICLGGGGTCPGPPLPRINPCKVLELINPHMASYSKKCSEVPQTGSYMWYTVF